MLSSGVRPGLLVTSRCFEHGGLGMELTWLVPVAGIAAVLFALWLARDVLSRDTGTAEMQEIGGMIFEGAMAFLSRQYRTIAIFAVLKIGRASRRERV